MTTSPLLDHPVLPPENSEEIARFNSFLHKGTKRAVLRGADGSETSIPEVIFEVLLAVAAAMNHGQAITVAPLNLKLTTQEAAEFLELSRPSVVKLLENGEIPYEQAGDGRHRKIQLSDLVAYQQKIRINRSENLSKMVRASATEGFYSEETPPNYLDVVKRIRKSRNK